MNEKLDPKSWWQLHLRNARGETLSESERQQYEAELHRQESEAKPFTSDLGKVKQLRAQAAELKLASVELRTRLSDLEHEIDAVEDSLSETARSALGVSR
jgi:cell division protein FtsB